MYKTQKPLVDACRSLGIAVQSYSPLGTGSTELLQSPTVVRIASEVGRTSAQVLLQWCLCRVDSVVVKAADFSHFDENLQIDDWELNQQQIKQLDQLEETEGTKRFCWV